MVYIFDFDGTLVDSMPIWAGVQIDALESAGIEVPKDFVKTITPLGNYNASKYTVSLGLDIPFEDYLKQVNETLVEKYTTIVPLKAHVKETLENLKTAGHSLNVLTASSHSYLEKTLERLGVLHLFDKVWSIEDFSLTKDKPEIYLQAAERLGVSPSDCYFADDNITAITTAKKAGMKTIGVYDDTSRDFTEEIKRISDKYVYDFKELI